MQNHKNGVTSPVFSVSIRQLNAIFINNRANLPGIALTGLWLPNINNRDFVKEVIGTI